MNMEYKRLGDIATYINGYAFKPSDWSDVGLPIIRIQDLTGTSYQTNKYNGKYDSKYEINKGDVLISWSASLGVYVWSGDKALLNQHIFKVLFNKAEVDKDFFVHQVSGILSKSMSEAHGATMKHLTKPVFDALPFYLPSVKRQKEIAFVLNCTAEIINKRKQQLEKLDELVKARFVEMFGDPIRNTQNRPTTDFINVVKMQRGFDLPVQDRKQDGTIPVFGSNGALDRHNVAKVYGGGVITGRSGTIGKVYYTEGDYWPLNTSLFSVDTHGNNVVYLAYLLQMYDLSRFTEGTGVPTLNRNKFHNKPIIDVPFQEQVIFADFVKQVDKSKFILQKALLILSNPKHLNYILYNQLKQVIL